MIEYSLNKKKVDLARLVQLFEQVGWEDKTEGLERLKAMVDNSQIVVTAWANDKMIGFARCTTDYVFNGQINNVVVDIDYRGQGVGKGLISRIVESSEQVTYILRGDPENKEFYKKLGFRDSDLTFVYPRKK